MPERPPDAPLIVTVTGAESTGKTTLAAALARHYGTVWNPEYLRTFVDRKGGLPERGDVRAIAEGHLQTSVEALHKATDVLILDTDLLSHCIYTRYFFGTCPAWLEEEAARHVADLYLLADVDIPWEPDPGQREGPAVRTALHAVFRHQLERRRLPYVLVGGTRRERLHTAVRHVDARLSQRTPRSKSHELRGA